MAFYAAIWAMPVVAPIVVGILVFIVLASVSIGVGTSHKFPAVVTVCLVAMSALVAGWAYRGTHRSLNPPRNMPLEYGQSQYAEVPRPVPMMIPVGMPMSGQGVLPRPKMPESILPQ